MSHRSIRVVYRPVAVATLTLLVGIAWASPVLARKSLPPTHYRLPIDPKTLETALLPTPPKSSLSSPTLKFDDLARVPEVQLQEPWSAPVLDKGALPKKGEPRLMKQTEWAVIHTARLTTQINFVNKKKPDRFIELLMENRPDLAGIPFIMGDACRLKAGERMQFKQAVQMVQNISPDMIAANAPNRWKAYDELRRDDHHKAVEDRFCGAACMQMMALESASFQVDMVARLAAFKKTDADKKAATHALTKLAVFSQDAKVRSVAIAALKKRNLGADVAVLAHGLNYPWPSIAQNTATAIAELKREELVPALIRLLDEPDPRVPTVREVKGKQVPVLREVVKINHHRNCLLCHPPGNTQDVMTFKPWDDDVKNHRIFAKDVTAMFVNIEKLADDVLVAPMPTPGEEISSGFEGYGSQFFSPEILIRADITYLRQDFSLAQKVDNAKPWPEMQRFDYLVRSRVLSEKDADAYRAELAKLGTTSPYREAALAALRRMTGHDAGTTGAAWREALAKK